nr:hypothetical protein [Tanacetum cinerariifolium]
PHSRKRSSVDPVDRFDRISSSSSIVKGLF